MMIIYLVGVSVNHTYVNPTKAKQVSVILLDTNLYNVWIRQLLYATTYLGRQT